MYAVVLHRRVNPFNESQENSASDGAMAPAAAGDSSTFAVRFLGSQQVLTDRGTIHSDGGCLQHCTHQQFNRYPSVKCRCCLNMFY